MLPSRSAYTMFSAGTFQRGIAASNSLQLRARSTASDPRYPAVPGSAPTHRSANARDLSSHNTGPCRVNLRSISTAGGTAHSNAFVDYLHALPLTRGLVFGGIRRIELFQVQILLVKVEDGESPADPFVVSGRYTR